MAYIGNTPAENYVSIAAQHFTVSATTSYSLNRSVTNETELALFINNVRQQPGSSYSYTATGTTLTLSAATAVTDTMYCVFLGKSVGTIAPPDGSVGTSTLATGAVTADKIADGTVVAAEIADGAVTDAKISAVATTKLTGTVTDAQIAAVAASKLTGTIADARLPATALNSNVDLTTLSASNLTSGTVSDARFPATLPAISGVNLTALNADNLGSGTVPTTRLGSGTASSSTFLRGDSTFAEPSGGNWIIKDIGWSTGTSLTFTSISSNVRILISMENVGSGHLELQLGTSGTIRTSGYAWLFTEFTPGASGSNSTSDSFIKAGLYGSFHTIDVLMPHITAHRTHVQHWGSMPEDGNYPKFCHGVGNHNSSEVHTQVKLEYSSGTAFTARYQVLYLNYS